MIGNFCERIQQYIYTMSKELQYYLSCELLVNFVVNTKLNYIKAGT